MACLKISTCYLKYTSFIRKKQSPNYPELKMFLKGRDIGPLMLKAVANVVCRLISFISFRTLFSERRE